MVMINKTSSKPYYEQLILSIKEDILHGVLRPGDQIPSVREMAKTLVDESKYRQQGLQNIRK